MSLKKYLSVISTPKTAIQYLKKYGKNCITLPVYNINRSLNRKQNGIIAKKIDNYIIYESQKIPNVFLQRELIKIDELLQETTYKERILEQANKGLNNNFLILNKTRGEMYNNSQGHYLWHRDFYENYDFKMSHFSKARSVNKRLGVDIKIPWETSRMQYLFSIGLGYRITRDEKYARKIIDIINDFIECNDYNEGPNWNVSMEIGIRIANIVLACELIKDSESFNESFYKKVCLCIYTHRTHIYSNLENVGGKTSNHFLGDLLGLATAVAACPFFPETNRIKEFVINSLHKELKRQINNDGSDFEGSTSYHRLVGELFSFTILAAERFGLKLDRYEKNMLLNMAKFDIDIQMHNGLVPQVGDNDSGRVFQLFEEETRNHFSCVNLLLSISNNRIIENDNMVFDGFICFYRLDVMKTDYSTIASKEKIIRYDDFGAIRYKGKDLYVLLLAATPEKNGMLGHAHNDILSFILEYKGKEIIVDPGSGEYTGHPEIRNMLRCTSSHSTVKIGDIEQRDIIPGLLFQWDGNVKAQIDYEDNLGITLCGNYRDEKKNIDHTREIKIHEKEKNIEIIDNIHSDYPRKSMTLPIHPDACIIKNGGDYVLTYGTQKIRINGTWNMEIRKGIYSTQYHEIVNNSYLYCTSNENVNVLKFFFE